MDFTIFPPEFNSLNIQGSARPFLVAANAWKNLSNELSYAPVGSRVRSTG